MIDRRALLTSGVAVAGALGVAALPASAVGAEASRRREPCSAGPRLQHVFAYGVRAVGLQGRRHRASVRCSSAARTRAMALFTAATTLMLAVRRMVVLPWRTDRLVLAGYRLARYRRGGILMPAHGALVRTSSIARSPRGCQLATARVARSSLVLAISATRG